MTKWTTEKVFEILEQPYHIDMDHLALYLFTSDAFHLQWYNDILYSYLMHGMMSVNRDNDKATLVILVDNVFYLHTKYRRFVELDTERVKASLTDDAFSNPNTVVFPIENVKKIKNPDSLKVYKAISDFIARKGSSYDEMELYD